MKATMKFYEHEGIAYVTFFPGDGTPITLSVDKAITYVKLHGIENGITLFHAETILGETTVRQKTFPWSTPNLAQAILEEAGAARLIETIRFDNRIKSEK